MSNKPLVKYCLNQILEVLVRNCGNFKFRLIILEYYAPQCYKDEIHTLLSRILRAPMLQR